MNGLKITWYLFLLATQINIDAAIGSKPTRSREETTDLIFQIQQKQELFYETIINRIKETSRQRKTLSQIEQELIRQKHDILNAFRSFHKQDREKQNLLLFTTQQIQKNESFLQNIQFALERETRLIETDVFVSEEATRNKIKRLKQEFKRNNPLIFK